MPDTPHDDTPEVAPRQKSEHAYQFLRLLGRDQFEFRALAEAPSVKGKANASQMLRRTGTFDKHKDELRRLNDAGYGIFVQVNEADGGFQSSKIIATPCLFADFDGVPRSNLDRLSCKPHAVFQTSPGKIHAYWRLADLALADFTPLQKRLISLLESDRVVHDRARIMRLPGFLHQKNPEQPFLVAPIEINDHPFITKAELVEALEVAEKDRGIQKMGVASPAQPFGSAKCELERSASALQFLITEGHIDPSRYEDWHRLAMALKHTHAEEGWPLWHSISAAAQGYDGQEICRAKWESFGETAGPPLTMATYFASAKEHGWQPVDADGAFGRGGKKEKDPDPAVVVLKQAEEEGDEFWLDENDRGHVSIRKQVADGKTRLQHMQIDSSRYRRTIAKRYYNGSRIKVLAAEQENRAISLLEQIAEEGGKRYPAFLRVGKESDAVYVDLGREDGQCVRVTAHGWSIIGDVPIRFVDSGHGELPLPEAGGGVEDFRKHFDLENSSLVRLMAFCLSCYHPQGSNPILLLEGGQGDGKSTMGDMVLALTDPPKGRKAGRMTLTNSERDLHIHGQNSHVLYFDNVSYLDGPVSDMLCRVATGAASFYRKLRTDAEEVKFALCRPVMLTCIAAPTTRNDFLNRCIKVTTRAPAHRKTEQALWANFDADRAKLVGFLLTALSAAMRNMNTVASAVEKGELRLPRMADFGLLVEAAAEAFGLKPGEFCTMLHGEQTALQADTAITDPLGDGLFRHFSAGGEPLHVTASGLLELLYRQYPEPRRLPPANKVVPRLKRILPGLTELGILVEIEAATGRANVCKLRITYHRASDSPEADHILLFRSPKAPF